MHLTEEVKRKNGMQKRILIIAHTALSQKYPSEPSPPPLVNLKKPTFACSGVIEVKGVINSHETVLAKLNIHT